MYILQIGNMFIKQYNKHTFLTTDDYQVAEQYSAIGDAMKIAAELNTRMQKPIIKVIFYGIN